MSWTCDQSATGPAIHAHPNPGFIFTQTIRTLLAAQCALIPKPIPETSVEDVEMLKGKTFDFIIVGGGTAGLVVANRLTEISKYEVLVLEAGETPTLGSQIPALFVNNFGGVIDWKYRTEPELQACINYRKQQCFWPSGKVLGGSSSINGMYYVRGNKNDFYEWSLIHNDWNYTNVLKYFKKSENLKFVGNKTFDINLDYHGTDGPLSVEYDTEEESLESLLIQANKELGVAYNKDFNGKSQMGVGKTFATINDGKRASTFNSFIQPILHRPNLHIMTNVYVDRVIFRENTAVGVQFTFEDSPHEVFASKDVILSAGTVGSATILLKSGIGPADQLIKPKLNLPVGKNLQNHVYVPIVFKTELDGTNVTLENILKDYVDYIKDLSGPLRTMKPQRVISFINTENPLSDTPNIQSHFLVLYPNQSLLHNLYIEHQLSEKFYKELHKINRDNLLIIVYVTLLQPRSKGYIGMNFGGKPLIYPNYLTDYKDMITLLEGIKFTIRLSESSFFKTAELVPHWFELDSCHNLQKPSDIFLECVARALTGTLNNAVGTNKMGANDDSNSVVDHRLRVKYITNLRVIDASVIPKITRGNTMATVIMIAEKGSEYIKKEWEFKSSIQTLAQHYLKELDSIYNVDLSHKNADTLLMSENRAEFIKRHWQQLFKTVFTNRTVSQILMADDFPLENIANATNMILLDKKYANYAEENNILDKIHNLLPNNVSSHTIPVNQILTRHKDFANLGFAHTNLSEIISTNNTRHFVEKMLKLSKKLFYGSNDFKNMKNAMDGHFDFLVL